MREVRKGIQRKRTADHIGKSALVPMHSAVAVLSSTLSGGIMWALVRLSQGVEKGDRHVAAIQIIGRNAVVAPSQSPFSRGS
jgi:hypothetical protein